MRGSHSTPSLAARSPPPTRTATCCASRWPTSPWSIHGRQWVSRRSAIGLPASRRPSRLPPMKRHSSLSSIALAATISLCICSPVLGDESLQREVEANVPNGPLRGTLLAPPGNASNASVVIVPGSGPTDRNGNNPLGATSGYLQSLAEALAGAGIASIRLDRRGMFASAGSFGDPNAVTFDDYAADALAWDAVAPKQTSADCAWLVGHSEGALVSLLAAAKSSDDLCGLVLLAAPGRKMGAVLREQLRANPHNQPLLADAEAAIDGLERGEHIDV